MENIITKKQKIKCIESVFGEGNVTNGADNISVKCPSCRSQSKNSSKKKKLAISLENGMYHCWVCEIKGRNIGLIARKYKLANKNELAELYDVFNAKKEDDVEKEITISLPEDFSLLHNKKGYAAKSCLNYLKERGLDYSDVLKFKFGISNSLDYANRIIIPSHNENLDLNFYLSRSIEPNAFRKYKNCEAKRKDIIFNEYLVDWQNPVVLVEGLFDAIKAGENAIPILGSWINEEYYLFEKIVKNNTPVILGFDPDAKDKERKVADLLYQYDIDVFVLDNYNKDFGDMSKKQVKSLIDNAKLYEQFDRITYLIQSIKSGSLF